MKDPKHEVISDPIRDARRYVKNAQDTLRDHGKLNKETGRYEDPKYVKAAGLFLWSGVLIALEAVFRVGDKKKSKKGEDSRVSIVDYIDALAKRDRKLLDWVNDGYQIMHLCMGYDGIGDKKVCLIGVQLANTIIDRCESMMVA